MPALKAESSTSPKAADRNRDGPRCNRRTVNNLFDQRTAPLTISAVVNVPKRDIAAIGCCNNQGAHHGSYAINNSTLTGTSGYLFTQLLLCTCGHNDTNPAAYGTVAYFSPTVMTALRTGRP